jgi:hypothetical protein
VVISLANLWKMRSLFYELDNSRSEVLWLTDRIECCPLVAAAVAVSIVTCFAPEQSCALLATGAIDAAHYEILLNAYPREPGTEH